MPTIKVLSWNIYKFGTHVTGNTQSLNLILDLVHPAAAAPAFDLFVVIEPQIGAGATEDLASGSGPQAMIKLRTSLQGRAASHATSAASWQAVPPMVLTASDKREALAVFYNAKVLTLKGPVDDVSITSTDWRKTATKGAGAGTLRGACQFKTSAGANLTFPSGGERRPYRVQFETVVGNKTFSILGAHSPSPAYSGSTPHARNKQARQGTEKLGQIKEVTNTHRPHPVIVVGDFNCCYPGHASGVNYNCTNTATDKDGEAEDGLTGEGFTSHIAGGGGAEPKGTSLKTVGSGTATVYTKHAYDYLLTAAGGGTAVAVANARILGLGDLTAGYNAGLNKTKFKPIFKRVRVSAGKGVSDHLPVAADVTI